LRDYGYQFGKRVKKEGAFIFRPQRNKQIFIGKDGIILIGEAAGGISPSSAEGLSYAFRSAFIAGEILKKAPANFSNIYQRKIHPLSRNILLKNLKSPFMYNPWLRRMMLRLGMRSIDVRD